MCIDEGGADYIWQRLFEDYHFGFIHLAVQMHIISRNPGIGMEQYVYDENNNICGRADIFNISTGEVWELKTTRTGAVAAEIQVKKYCGKHLRNSTKPLKKGSDGSCPVVFSGTFELECMGDYYIVEYFTPEPGVILYKATKTDSEVHDPYAVYVPIPQTTPERRTTIGGVPQYSSSVCSLFIAAAGFAVVGAFVCGGYCKNNSSAFN